MDNEGQKVTVALASLIQKNHFESISQASKPYEVFPLLLYFSALRS